MEIEVKYTAKNPDILAEIWTDQELKFLESIGSRSSDHFNANYYDTKFFDLKNNNIAYRIREEGNILVATLKWGGTNTGALHKREELNINIGEGAVPPVADPNLFAGSEEGELITNLIGENKLEPFITVRNIRKKFLLEYGGSLLELSLDSGEVIAGGKREEINELEIELFNGDEKDLLKLGEKLKKKYDLVSEGITKFARGLRLLGLK